MHRDGADVRCRDLEIALEPKAISVCGSIDPVVTRLSRRCQGPTRNDADSSTPPRAHGCVAAPAA